MSYRDEEIEGADGLKDGEMRQVRAGETDLLLARVNGQLHAVGAFCPHYHAPLADGVLEGTRLVCPWHQACYDVTNGALLEPPALDGLAVFEVAEENGRVTVRVPADAEDRRTPAMAAADTNEDGRTFVVVGAGAAGYAAAQTLREESFRGRVVMVTSEKRLPYDRPNLSKDYLAGTAEPEWMPLRPDEFYEENGIEVMLGREVVSLDAQAKTITFDGGESISYDAALVATGGAARRPPIPGVDLGGVFTLRSFDDADAIVAAAAGTSRAVVVGASFIGMETAASLRARELSVTVVAPESVPFDKTLGPEIGSMLRTLHEEHGVRFELGAAVASFEGDGAVRTVVLDDGRRIDADLVVLGAGVRPVTGFVRGVQLHDDGSLVVDEGLRAAEGLYAAGDVARFTDPRTGESTRIEHWRTAEQQGRTAARNMAGRNTPYTAVPFFWTNQYGEGVQYVGHASRWDEVLVEGDVAGRDFLAVYVQDGRIVAAAGSGRDAQMGAFAESLRLGRLPSPDVVRAGPVDWLAIMKG